MLNIAFATITISSPEFIMSETLSILFVFFFFQAEDGIRDKLVTGVQTCALPISCKSPARLAWGDWQTRYKSSVTEKKQFLTWTEKVFMPTVWFIRCQICSCWT